MLQAGIVIFIKIKMTKALKILDMWLQYYTSTALHDMLLYSINLTQNSFIVLKTKRPAFLLKSVSILQDNSCKKYTIEKFCL